MLVVWKQRCEAKMKAETYTLNELTEVLAERIAVLELGRNSNSIRFIRGISN